MDAITTKMVSLQAGLYYIQEMYIRSIFTMQMDITYIQMPRSPIQTLKGRKFKRKARDKTK